MAQSAPARALTWGDGLQVAAQDIRLGQLAALLSGLGSGSSPLQSGSGVRDGNGNPLQVSVVSGLSVLVNTGLAGIQGSAAANSGVYGFTLDSAATLTCSAADLVNPRIDSVIALITDNGNNTSAATVNIITGTPSGAPSPPSLPANSLLLCNVTVPANATSLNSGNLSDQRTFLAAAGGIKPYRNSGGAPSAGPSSGYGHNIATGRLTRWNGSKNVAPSVAAFAPVSASSTSSVSIPSGSPGAQTQILALNFTCDGNTEVRIVCKRPGIYMSVPVTGAQLANQLLLDGTQFDAWFDTFPSGIPANDVAMGMTFEAYLTPANGTHTLEWAGQATSSQAFGVYGAAPSPLLLRVGAESP